GGKEEMGQVGEREWRVVRVRQVAVLSRRARRNSVSRGRPKWRIVWLEHVEINARDQTADPRAQIRSAQRQLPRQFPFEGDVVLLDAGLGEVKGNRVD